jgi:hypothetical protein
VDIVDSGELSIVHVVIVARRLDNNPFYRHCATKLLNQKRRNEMIELKEGQVVKDNKGAKWVVLGYAFNMVRVRPQSDQAFKEYGITLMPRNMLFVL